MNSLNKFPSWSPLLPLRRILNPELQDAKMTSLLSVEEQETGSLGPSTSPLDHHHHHHHHHQHHQQPHHQTSIQSSEVEYEIAQQLVQHSQGDRDGSGEIMVGSSQERRPSTDFVVAATSPKEDYRATDKKLPDGYDVRRTPSQERPPESHYAPISIPPASGQMCR